MKVFFDSQEDFMKDLEAILAPLSKFNNPLVVLPTERDVNICSKVSAIVAVVSLIFALGNLYHLDTLGRATYGDD